ncbi:MAG: hypothetical protein J5379_02750 [Clostridiales bacterium]|nr:hypothetical protein [Clostridiales bacterium]
MDSGKRNTILIVLLLILGAIMIFLLVRDRKESVISRKTGYSIPDYCTVEKYEAYGSIFNRPRFEAKIKIDTPEHMGDVIVDMNRLLGDDYHEIPLAEYNIEKYSLFADQKLMPEPTGTSWVIVGKAGQGTLVVFVCQESQNYCYMYMYYND